MGIAAGHNQHVGQKDYQNEGAKSKMYLAFLEIYFLMTVDRVAVMFDVHSS
jgi:hypothetical protein